MIEADRRGGWQAGNLGRQTLRHLTTTNKIMSWDQDAKPNRHDRDRRRYVTGIALHNLEFVGRFGGAMGRLKAGEQWMWIVWSWR